MKNRFVCRGLSLALALALSCSIPQVYAQSGSTEKVTVTATKKPLEKVLEKLGKQYGYQIFYAPSLLNGIEVTAGINGLDIDSAMKQLLRGSKLQYTRRNNVIVITSMARTQTSSVMGRVIDSEGVTLPGVSVFNQDMSMGASTDIDGRFSFKALPHGSLLTFTSVGMKPQYVLYNGEKTLQITMEEDVAQLDAVVVTGFQTISRERSTGSATIVNKEYLDKIQAHTFR